MSAPACGRLGCDSTACCVLLIAAQECEAWLVGFDHDSADQGVKLCEAHADRITVPFGWGLHNERPTPRKRRRRATTPKPSDAPPPTEADSASDAAGERPAPRKAATGKPPSSKATKKTPAKKRASKSPATTPAEPAEPASELRREPILDDLPAPSEEPTVPLPAADDVADAAMPPADVPVSADHVADALAEADDPRHLQVVARDAGSGAEDDAQPALWDDDEPDAQLDPTDRTPLLKRAFRVVRDD